MIELKEVSYSYSGGKQIFKDLRLLINPNQFTAIKGHNGSGKTTLGKLMTGILKPTSGEVFIDGKSTETMTLGEIGRKIGYLFQDPERQLFSTIVKDEMDFILALKGLTAKEIDERVNDALASVELETLSHQLTHLLSRGEKQRLALAAIIVNEPKFLILDEPTTGLDIIRRKKLSQLIEGLIDRGIGMAVISHDEEFINQHAHRKIILREGEVIDDFFI